MNRAPGFNINDPNNPRLGSAAASQSASAKANNDQLAMVERLAKTAFSMPLAYIVLDGQDQSDHRPQNQMDHGALLAATRLNSKVIQTRQPLALSDVELDESFAADEAKANAQNIRFYAGAPIIVGAVAVGALCLIDLQPRIFSRDELQQLELLAVSAAGILTQNAKYETANSALPPQTPDASGPLSTAEQSLGEATTFQELIFKHIPDLIFVKDADFRIVQANEHFLGVYPEDMRGSIIGSTTIEQYNEEEREAFLEQDRIAFDKGLAETEESIDFPDGTRRTLLTRKVRFEDSKANAFVLGIGRDISELVDSRREKQLSYDLLNSVFDTVSGAVIGLDADKNVVMVNNAGLHMLGETKGRTPFAWPDEITFLDREDMRPLESSHDPIARALIGQEIGGEIHLMTRKSSAQTRYIRVTSRLVQAQSSSLRTVVVLDDVSEAERNRQQLERQSRLDALGQLTGGIAHDFNNLLNTMQFAIELIRRDNLSERGQRSANAALNSINRGSELTSRLLAFAKKQPERAAARAMSETLAELKELVEPSIEASVTVKFGSIDEDLLAFCDQGQLQNAVLNLILNSRDAIMETGQGSTIKVEARGVDFLPTGISAAAEDGPPPETEGRLLQSQADAARNDGRAQRYIEISVSDNGPGMSKEIASRALDPFFTTKLVNSGTGLGLSMVYGFVQQSDGEMRIYTEEGQGTAVRMFLPRGDESTGLEEPFALAPLVNGNGETILVAEDEEFLRDQLGELLKELNYTVIEAASGRDAVAILEGGATPDLILTDVVMPGGVGGFELARKARAILPNVPIIYMSGYTGFTNEEMGEVIAPLLPKPSSPSVISGQIRAILDTVKE